MYEFENVLDVTHGAYVVNRLYGEVNNSDDSSSEATARNRVVAVIRELPGVEIAVFRKNAKDASDAVSIIQIFTDAIETIAEKLAKILELARKAIEPYSHLQADEIQQQFRDLAEEINQTVDSTEYNYNKPFTVDGKSFSIPVGDSSKIEIIAKDFRFDAKGLNIATDPQNALSTAKEAIANIDEYKMYLDRQAARLEDISAAFELEMQDAMGVDMQDFQPELAVPMADYVTSLIQQDKQTSLNSQANLTPNEILKLLKVDH